MDLSELKNHTSEQLEFVLNELLSTPESERPSNWKQLWHEMEEMIEEKRNEEIEKLINPPNDTHNS